MNINTLGYSEKWLQYGFLTEQILNQQLLTFNHSQDKNTEHYRYSTLQKWIKDTQHFTDIEIHNFIEIALDDADIMMTGSAVKQLFINQNITQNQFNIIKNHLPKFGDWTTRLIHREVLRKRLYQEEITDELVNMCIDFSHQYNDNQLIRIIIEKINDKVILSDFTTERFSKKIRNMAKQKIV